MRIVLSKYVVCLLAVLISATAKAEVADADSTKIIKADTVVADTLPTVKDLEEVVVERSNVIRRGMTDSYIVTEEMRKGKYSAGELLRNIAGMDYHPMTEEVRYLGSTKVVILLDSVPKDEAYIKRQSPNRFDRIDIVEHPGGIYKDYDVLINFHPRPHYTGFELNTRANINILPNGNNGRGKDVQRLFPYIDGTYMYDKLTVAANASWTWQRDGSSTYSSTEYPLNNYSETMLTRDRKDPIQMARYNQAQGELSVDYRFNDNHKISGLWKIESFDNHVDNGYELAVNDNGVQSNVSVSQNTGMKDALTNTFVLYYLGTFGKWSMDVSTDYINSSWKSHYGLNRSDDYSLMYDRKGVINYYYLRANVGRPFMDYKWQLNFYANVFVNNTKESDLYTHEVLTSTQTSLYSLAATAVYCPNPKWSYYGEIGMSLYSGKEAGIKTTRVDPRWQININWMPTDKVRLNAFYLMQTMTPQNAQIQDYGQFVDKFKYQEGNPSLKSGIYNMAYLGLTLWRRFTVFGQYDFTNAYIYNIFTAANSNPMNPDAGYYYALGRYQNGKSRTLKFGANFWQPLRKGFSIRFNGTVNREQASFEGFSNKEWLPTGSVGLWYENNKYYWLGAFEYVVRKEGEVTPQQFSRKSYDAFNLMIRKGFLKNRLSVMAQWTLPVHIVNGEFKSLMTSPDMIQSSWGNDLFRRNNRLFFSISYRFNKGKQVQKTRLDVQNVSPGSIF